MTLRGPSKTVIVEPLETPAAQPQPQPAAPARPQPSPRPQPEPREPATA